MPNSEPMIYLIYASSATRLFSRDELVELLNEARERNASRGITGMLLYKDGNFLQLLEGEKEAVIKLFDKIKQDPRHRGVLNLIQGAITERQFPDWSMGFYDLRATELKNLPGYSDFLNTPLTGSEFTANPTRCQKLLLLFKRNN